MHTDLTSPEGRYVKVGELHISYEELEDAEGFLRQNPLLRELATSSVDLVAVLSSDYLDGGGSLRFRTLEQGLVEDAARAEEVFSYEELEDATRCPGCNQLPGLCICLREAQ